MVKLGNQKGQSLIEYLIILAIMGVASLGAMRLLNHTVSAQFTDIIYALQGSKKRTPTEAPSESLYKKKDMSNFMNGAASADNK